MQRAVCTPAFSAWPIETLRHSMKPIRSLICMFPNHLHVFKQSDRIYRVTLSQRPSYFLWHMHQSQDHFESSFHSCSSNFHQQLFCFRLSYLIFKLVVLYIHKSYVENYILHSKGCICFPFDIEYIISYSY